MAAGDVAEPRAGLPAEPARRARLHGAARGRHLGAQRVPHGPGMRMKTSETKPNVLWMQGLFLTLPNIIPEMTSSLARALVATAWGPFTNDVSTEGERGGYPNSDAVREVV